jgi:TM2 domain-containing membrane protein YozV
MKKTTFLLFLFFALLGVTQLNAASYTLDEQKIDQLFDEAVETSMITTLGDGLTELPAGFPALAVASGDKDVVVALLLDFFLGGLGIHRFYLGTKTMTGIGYILTCGGIFGIVPLIDFIVLIIDNDDISPYIDNPKFFMW